MEQVFEYTVNTDNSITIFQDNKSIADVADCKSNIDKNTINNLIENVLFDLGLISETEVITINKI